MKKKRKIDSLKYYCATCLWHYKNMNMKSKKFFFLGWIAWFYSYYIYHSRFSNINIKNFLNQYRQIRSFVV